MSNITNNMKGEEVVKLVSRDSWDIWSPPPTNSLAGALIPRALNRKRRRRRRLTVEVWEKDGLEECLLRVLVPSKKGGSSSNNGEISHSNEEDDDDDSTVLGGLFRDDAEAEEGWKSKYKFPLSALTVKGDYHSTLTVVVDLGKIHQTRDLIFDSIPLLQSFLDCVKSQRLREEERAQAKFQAVVGSTDATMSTTNLRLLVEIVSGWDLPVGDLTSSDPYVLCLLNGKEVHRTAYISKTLDPIWTLKTGSLFLLQVMPQKLFTSTGLVCHVMDFDKLGKNETLGTFTITPKDLYQAQGERMEFKLQPPPGSSKPVPGHVAMRVRPASEYDAQFLQDYNKAAKKTLLPKKLRQAMEKSELAESRGGSSNLTSYLRKQSRTVKSKDRSIAPIKEFKIRPGPHPHRTEETTWMTEDALQAECLKESEEWIDTGSGKLGRLFVEVLGCNDLPNLDTGGRNKTDAFVSIVYQDSHAMTDIIDDCLSPRWMPWTKRAFIFHIMHPSSQLFLGVFDNDDGLTDDHDLVGRVSVDLQNLRKDTTYTLDYHIYTTARMKDRECNGSIRVRLRLEIPDERQLLLSILEPPPELYVNCKRRKDFRVIRYTCTGKYDMEKYNLKFINSYVEELLALQHALFYLQDAFTVLLLWRGTTIYGNLKFPIHSLTAFLVMTFIVEYPQYIPSVMLMFMGWSICAVMDYRTSIPDPWSHCKTFTEFLITLVAGKSPVSNDDIPQNHREEEALAYHEAWQQRIIDSEEAGAKAYEENLKAQEELEKEMEEIGDTNTDISTGAGGGGGISLDPFKPILYPIQQNLGMVCRYLRHARFIIFWQESYFAFWIASACFLLAFMFMFVPWFFLIRWTCRIIVWTVFGPWMKLVDVFYVSKLKPPTEEDIAAKKLAEKERRREATFEAAGKARIKREDARKLKAMKKYMFGKFIAKVPVLKEDRYRDIPLPSSSAVPYQTKALGLSELAMQEAGYHRKRVPGQHLVGHMIPHVETLGFTEAPIGQATKAAAKSSKDSDSAAYAKLGGLAVAAAVITYFAVPFLASMAERFFGS